MSFFKDAIAVFKKREISLLESYKEADDVYTFLFEKENDLTWEAGQHGLFTITHKKIKNGTKPFTVASAPSENVIKLTMKIKDNPSEFKKAMLELEKGMKISMSGPIGSFYQKGSKPTLFIAAGIGITPFRSILKQFEAEGIGTDTPKQLIYLDSNRTHVFKEEIDELAKKTAVTVTYLDSKDGLHQEIDKFINLYKNDGNYFIAGPKSMVDSVTTYLQSKQIPKRNIKKDAFFGY